MSRTCVESENFGDKIIDLIKQEYNIKTDSEALSFLISEFEDFLESQIRPEYIEELKRIDKGKFNTYSSIDELRAKIEGKK